MNARDAVEQPASPPPNVVLMQLMMGFYVSRAIYVAARLGLPDLIAGGTRASEPLADATGTHAPSLRRLMRWLTSVGVFVEQEDGSFTLTPVGECLRSGVPGSMRAGALLFTGMTQDAWKGLLYSVQTGEPAFPRVFGTDSFSYMTQHPDEAANFDAAMAEFTAFVATAVTAVYDFSGLGTIIDVGGGNGTLLAGILRATPSLRGVLFDLPHVAERAKKRLEAEGVSDRCAVAAGDFFAEVPPGGDAYVLKHVIHDWDDARALTILRNCRRAMDGRGKLLIVEGVYPPRIDDSLASRSAASNDVNMLVCTGGRQRSEAEFRSLYDQAGFTLARIVPTMANSCVVEGVPAL
jgi:orsellinic acid C2-O-methyltransferase